LHHLEATIRTQKQSTLDKESAAKYLSNGAQPSDRVVRLLQAEKVALPAWVNVTSDKKKKSIKAPQKLRRNQPKEEVVEAPAEEAPVEAEAEAVVVEEKADA
jgi:ribosomal protein S16